MPPRRQRSRRNASRPSRVRRRNLCNIADSSVPVREPPTERVGQEQRRERYQRSSAFILNDLRLTFCASHPRAGMLKRGVARCAVGFYFFEPYPREKSVRTVRSIENKGFSALQKALGQPKPNAFWLRRRGRRKQRSATALAQLVPWTRPYYQRTRVRHSTHVFSAHLVPLRPAPTCSASDATAPR